MLRPPTDIAPLAIATKPQIALSNVAAARGAEKRNELAPLGTQ
jgi:hypothetical protein